jgi:tetratricopeptide (TPR) repeat protein
MERELREARGRLASFRGSGDAANLDGAVAAGERALALCSPDTPERFEALLELGAARGLRSQFRADAAGSLSDLERAVEVYREAAQLVPTANPDLTRFTLEVFAGASLQLGELTRERRPVEEAVHATKTLNELATSKGITELHAIAAEYFGLALRLLPPDHPDRRAVTGLRGAALVQWTEKTGDLSRLADATEEVERALRLYPPGHPDRRACLALLGSVRSFRYEQDGTLDALDACLDVKREVLDHYPADHPLLAATLHNLGVLCSDRYRFTSEVTDLDSAAHYLRLAVDRAPNANQRAKTERILAEVAELRRPLPEVHLPPSSQFVAGPGSTPHRPAAEVGDDVDELARYSAALSDQLERYERTEDLALLERICADGRALLAGLPAGYPHRWLIGIPLGPALMRRFEVHGDPADLDEAVQLLREAVERPVLSPAHVVGELVNLAAALINRFRWDRSSADVDEAITYCRRALELTPDGGPGRVRYLHTLGTALVYRFNHLGRRFDLDEAIEIGQAALDTATERERDHARANLGNRLRERFNVGHDPADIDAAVTHLRAAVASEDKPDVRLTLALALHDRSSGSGDRDDLLDALTQFRAVLAATTERSPIHFTAQLGLAKALADLDHTDEAVATLEEAAERGAGRSFERMDALAMLAELRTKRVADGRDEWSAAAKAYADTIEQLHLAVWRGLTTADRRQLLTRWPNIACDAAAAALAAGEPEHAVELLDHGRSLLWGQVLDARTDLAALSAAHPDLAARLSTLGAEADAGGTAEHRRRVAKAWDDVVTSIRTQPGFERFLLSTPFAELADVAENGPVVLVNISRYRCDALVLTTSGVHTVPLPDLTAAEADTRTRDYLRTVARVGTGGTSSGPREQALLAYVEWLWDVAAEPVLSAVQPPAGARLWWCPTGPLALAPLHAAGYHDPDDTPGRTVLDRVVSSTTPTLRALRHVRRSSPPGSHRLLVVACDQRPDYVTGLPDLPSAVQEAELLRSRFPGTTVLTGSSATKANVTALLTEHTCTHFACHAGTQAADQAALFLTDAPLTTTDIAELDLSHAQLAVLSACHTAMGDANLPDEAHHLAAALQVAGFRHVVSTLWAINDDTATTIADNLYQALIAPDGTLNPSRTANTIHSITHDLRQRNPYRPSTWAPYVHFGL